ncbi:MAG: GNAT family N-acetyltransferase [Fibrobacterales bacterium]|nr:GNAT family N-acetyltransferase [Fibrobacterales bacterium]
MTLYGLAHLLRDRAAPLWNAVEAANGRLFALSRRKRLARIPGILAARSGPFILRAATPGDADALAEFFAAQPAESFEFFRPHGFDAGTLRRLLGNPGFLAFLALEGGEVAGYFFMRCFAGGKGFAGWFVDRGRRGRGLGGLQISVLAEIARALDARLFCSVSPRNAASAAALKASARTRLLRTLDDGSELAEILP